MDFKCWLSDPAIRQYYDTHNVTGEVLQSRFIGETHEAVKRMPRPLTPINWYVVLTPWRSRWVTRHREDVLVPSAVLLPSTVINVWRNTTHLLPITRAYPYRTLFSAGWYVNEHSRWTDFYNNGKPHHLICFYSYAIVNNFGFALCSLPHYPHGFPAILWLSPPCPASSRPAIVWRSPCCPASSPHACPHRTVLKPGMDAGVGVQTHWR